MDSTTLLWGIYLPPLVTLLFFGLRWARNSLSKSPSRDGISGRRNSLFGFLGGNGFSTVLTTIASLGSAVCSIAVILNFNHNLSGNIPALDLRGHTPSLAAYYVDGLSIYFTSVVNIIALFASFFTFRINERGGEESRQMYRFHFWFNLFHFIMLLVPLFSNLLVAWCLIALTTVTSVPLISFPKSIQSATDPKRNKRPREAALKYVLISAFSLTFALLGTILFGIALRSSVSLTWPDLQHSFAVPGAPTSKNQEALLAFAFLLILLGYGAKAGLFPMHTWLPDGHGEAPSAVSALLSGVLLKSALYILLRFYIIIGGATHAGNFAANTLAAFGLLSLVMATPFILNTNPKNRFKRILAYHSLEHMGIIVFAFGIGTPLAYFGALLHVLNHGFTKALMFLAYGYIQRIYSKVLGAKGLEIYEPADEHKYVLGVLEKMPFTGAILGFGGLALVGLPPFSIFFSEFIILFAAIQKWALDPSWASLAGKAAIVLYSASIALIFAGLIIHLQRLLLGKAPKEVREQVLPWPDRLGRFGTVIVLLVLLTVGMTLTTFTTWPYTKALQQSVCILNMTHSMEPNNGC